MLSKLTIQPKRYSQGTSAVIPPGKGLGAVEWVLARPLYRFLRFDMAIIPRAQRGQALGLKITQASPYAETAHYIAWVDEVALVWMWDAERISSAIEAQKLNPFRINVVPETLLQPPQNAPLCLQACVEGYDGQIWEKGTLKHSRWWSKLPGAAEWIAFQRDAGITPELQRTHVPGPVARQWQKTPWVRRAGLGQMSASGLRLEMAMRMLMITVFSLTTFWYAASLLKLQQTQQARLVELQSLEARSEKNRLARGQALEELAAITDLQSINRYPDQLTLMALVAKRLPQNGAYLKEWDYHSGTLKMTVAAPNAAGRSEYVKMFQKLNAFENVQAAPAADTANLLLTMTVNPHAEFELADELTLPAVKDSSPVRQTSQSHNTVGSVLSTGSQSVVKPSDSSNLTVKKQK